MAHSGSASPIGRLTRKLGIGTWQRGWPSAIAIGVLLALTATVGLARAGRLPTTSLSSGPDTTTGAASSEASDEATLEDGAADSGEETLDVPYEGPAAELVVPPDASRLVAQTPIRVIDTRQGGGGAGDAPLAFEVDDGIGSTEDYGTDGQTDSQTDNQTDDAVAAVVVSVSVMNATDAGAVLLDGGAGVVEAARLPKPGATTTNLVTVPLDGDVVTVRSTAGGAVVVDVVGHFEPVAEPVAAGRFVPVAPLVVAELDTATDGRELAIDLDDPALDEPALDEPALDDENAYGDGYGYGAAPVTEGSYGTDTEADSDDAALDPDTLAQLSDDAPRLRNASAVLAVITADVGEDGGMVEFGPSPEEMDQMLMWAPTSGEDRDRRGLVLLEPTDERLTTLRYNGGARLTVEIVGYFTDDDAPVDRAGLFVPSGPRPIYDGALVADTPVTVRGLRTDAAVALVTLAPRAGAPGQLGSSAVAIDFGALSVAAENDTDATVILLGEFLA